jgi:hypothetical protein
MKMLKSEAQNDENQNDYICAINSNKIYLKTYLGAFKSVLKTIKIDELINQLIG